jgi:hypothetical protein
MVALLALLWGFRAQAQQTIFNVPSADVAPPGKVFLQQESQFRPYAPGRFWLGTHYAVVGIGHHTELDATLFNVSSPASGSITLGLGAKTAWSLLEKRFPKRELKLTVGDMIPISLQGEGVGNWSYAHLSGRMPKLNTRLTAGVSTGTRQIFGRTTVGFIGGIEQPITSKLTLVSDWYSGTHADGYLIAGFSQALPRQFNLYVGYQIPNNARVGKGGFVLELSKLLP